MDGFASPKIWEIPSGKHTKSYGKWPFIVDLPINSMVIFHSYVSLPEGIVILHPKLVPNVFVVSFPFKR
jgi:hypothetical protein